LGVEGRKRKDRTADGREEGKASFPTEREKKVVRFTNWYAGRPARGGEKKKGDLCKAIPREVTASRGELPAGARENTRGLLSAHATKKRLRGVGEVIHRRGGEKKGTAS